MKFKRNSNSIKNSRFAIGAVFFALICPIVVLFWRVILSGNMVYGMDHIQGFYYLREYGFKSLSSLTLPFWNPYIFCGMPFIGLMDSAIFYPLNFFHLILPTGPALNYTIMLHLFLSGLFMYAYLRELSVARFGALVAGVVFMLSGVQISYIYSGHPTHLCAVAWMPLLFLLAERVLKREKLIFSVVLAGLVLGVQILAGQPQYVYYTLFALFFYVLFRTTKEYRTKKEIRLWWDSLALFFAVGIIGVFLSAIQLFPALEFTRFSDRSGGVNFFYAAVSSLPPENILTFMVPEFFGNGLTSAYWARASFWETCGYVGILPLVLCLVAALYYRSKHTLFFIFLAIFSFLLSLGRFAPLYKIFYLVVPGFKLFRIPARFLLLTTFSLAALSGFGAELLVKNIDKKRFKKFIQALAWITVTVVFAALVIGLGLREKSLFWQRLVSMTGVVSIALSERLNQEFFSTAYFDTLRFAALLVIAVLLVFWRWKVRLASRFLQSMVLVALIFDLLTFGQKYVFPSRRSDYLWGESTVGFFNRCPHPYRALLLTKKNISNRAMAYKVPCLFGYESTVLKRYAEFINNSQGFPLNLMIASRRRVRDLSPLLDLLNLKYIIIEAERFLQAPDWGLVFQNEEVNVYQNKNFIPRVFILRKWKVINQKQRLLDELKSGDFHPREWLILEEQPLEEIRAGDKEVDGEPLPRIIEYLPNRVVVETELSQPGFLVLGDVYYPGWKARVDGKETKIYRADYILRAVPLSEGKHKVEFTYSPFSFKLGLTITLTTLLACAVFLICFNKRKKKR